MIHRDPDQPALPFADTVAARLTAAGYRPHGGTLFGSMAWQTPDGKALLTEDQAVLDLEARQRFTTESTEDTEKKNTLHSSVSSVVNSLREEKQS